MELTRRPKSARRRRLAVVATLMIAGSATATTAALAPSDSAGAACKKYTFIGVPGTNEGYRHNKNLPYGKHVGQIRSAFLSKVGSSNVQSYYIDYMANANYATSEADGRNKLRAKVKAVRSSCGSTTKFVLAGYSQGAHVVGDILLEISRSGGPAPLSSLKKGILIGSPMFNKNNTSVSRWVGGKGTGAPFWGFRSWPSSLNGKVLDICIKTDPICDGTVGSFIGWAAGAKTAHGDYGTRKYTGSSYVITKWAGVWLGT